MSRPRLAVVVSVLLLPLAVIGWRSVAASKADFESGQQLVQAGNGYSAATQYRRAARWTFPLNPYPSRARAQLRELATAATARGDTELALRAWRAIAASAAATRSVFGLASAERDEALGEIATLTGSRQPPAAILQVSPLPHLLLLLGLALWIGAGWTIAGRLGAGEDARAVLLSGRSYVGVIGFGLYVGGMFFA